MNYDIINRRGDDMRINSISIDEISFKHTEYTPLLKDSLLRVGQNFPIYVSRKNESFSCLDGHKRLSAIYDILQECPENQRFQNLKVIIQEEARTAPPYTLHNHH